ncbi:MAG: hypothetical protein WBP45_02500 [Daejeonella sp.]
MVEFEQLINDLFNLSIDHNLELSFKINKARKLLEILRKNWNYYSEGIDDRPKLWMEENIIYNHNLLITDNGWREFQDLTIMALTRLTKFFDSK